MGYRSAAIAMESGGLLSDTTLGLLLDELTNRLPANDLLGFNTFARMKRYEAQRGHCMRDGDHLPPRISPPSFAQKYLWKFRKRLEFDIDIY
jgi:hypothetical protein